MTVAAYVTISHQFMAAKPVGVGIGADVLRADTTRGPILAEALDYLAARTTSTDTVTVIPEGIMINYWLRLPSPSRFVEYHPAAIMMHGEREMLASLEPRPPDWIVLVHRDHWEYGARYFGKDYGRSIGRWLSSRYVAASRFGATPFQSDQFGIVVVKRVDSDESD